ncbi:hypothetical protein [Methanocaldococcus infernus]
MNEHERNLDMHELKKYLEKYPIFSPYDNNLAKKLIKYLTFNVEYDDLKFSKFYIIAPKTKRKLAVIDDFSEYPDNGYVHIGAVCSIIVNSAINWLKSEDPRFYEIFGEDPKYIKKILYKRNNLNKKLPNKLKNIFICDNLKSSMLHKNKLRILEGLIGIKFRRLPSIWVSCVLDEIFKETKFDYIFFSIFGSLMK